MADLLNIEAKDLPKCGVCKGREVVTGYCENTKDGSILSFYCHGEEDIIKLKDGEAAPETAFETPKPTIKPKSKGKSKK